MLQLQNQDRWQIIALSVTWWRRSTAMTTSISRGRIRTTWQTTRNESRRAQKPSRNCHQWCRGRYHIRSASTVPLVSSLASNRPQRRRLIRVSPALPRRNNADFCPGKARLRIRAPRRRITCRCRRNRCSSCRDLIIPAIWRSKSNRRVRVSAPLDLQYRTSRSSH